MLRTLLLEAVSAANSPIGGRFGCVDQSTGLERSLPRSTGPRREILRQQFSQSGGNEKELSCQLGERVNSGARSFSARSDPLYVCSVRLPLHTVGCCPAALAPEPTIASSLAPATPLPDNQRRISTIESKSGLGDWTLPGVAAVYSLAPMQIVKTPSFAQVGWSTVLPRTGLVPAPTSSPFRIRCYQCKLIGNRWI